MRALFIVACLLVAVAQVMTLITGAIPTHNVGWQTSALAATVFSLISACQRLEPR
jgi:hypothetical protein